MIQIGEKIKLNNEKEYIVINKMNLHSVEYIFLMTNIKPLEIIIVTEKIVNGDIVLDEIKDNNELEYVLSKFALTKSDD